MNETLANRRCVPCQGGVPPLPDKEKAELLEQLRGWEIVENHHLSKWFEFPGFSDAQRFIMEVADLAEEQGHHPEIFWSFRKVRIDIWTHKIDNLVEADFVLAAKIDQIL